MRQLVVGDPEPAEPLRLVLAGPQGRVALPERLALPSACHSSSERSTAASIGCGQVVGEAVDSSRPGFPTLTRHRLQQRLERFDEETHAVREQLRR